MKAFDRWTTEERAARLTRRKGYLPDTFAAESIRLSVAIRDLIRTLVRGLLP